MDRVELSAEDIEELIAWRDENKDLVRFHPAPLKAVEIVMKHNGYRVKGIRNGQSLKLYLNHDGRSVGRCDFTRTDDGMFKAGPGGIRLQESELYGGTPQEMAQTMLTVYCSLMALMTYGPSMVEPSDETRERTEHKSSGKATRKPTQRITYILRRVNGTLLAAPRGSHASPGGIFSVRGHFRHYKSGKVVWIAEYKKGTGKKKRKTYKLGGKA